jgi:hypothetical protein
LTLLFQDGSVANVNVLFVLIGPAPRGSSAISSRRLADGCSPAQLLPVVASLGTNFTVPAGWPSTIETRVVDDCGDPLLEGSVIASFSNGDPPLPLISLKNGRWLRTWIPRNSGSAPVTVTVTADGCGARRQRAGLHSGYGRLASQSRPPGA